MVMDDFCDMPKENDRSMPAAKKHKADAAEPRMWLKIWETLPPQLLNAYGPAKYNRMSDEDVWSHMSEPLNSGAMYMSEMCSKDAERRGTGINRWLHAVLTFCKYQKDDCIMRQNQALLVESKCKELYAEIDRIMQSLEFCLAPKKYKSKSGAASLRSSGIPADMPVSKDPVELDKHAKVLYEWLDTNKVSRIRMMLSWQGSAGLAYPSLV